MVSWETMEQRPEAPPAQLHVHLLGTPEVRWQGEPLALPRRQVRALLYYLAAEARPVCRDSLCFLFWPDAGETTARHNLSRLLTLLHNALPDPAALAAHDDQLELRRACVWSDTSALHELSADWRAHGSLDALRRAADIHRGPFLDGLCLPNSPEFDLWVSQQRERWERLALQTLAALVDALALEGDYAGAITYAQRALAIDELAEDVQRRLIELYALAGQRSAALRQYERCVAVLERELGVDPTPETQAVYRAVLRGAAVATLPTAAAPSPATASPLAGLRELALEGFARLDQPSLRLNTLDNLSTLALYRGDPARALELAQQALAMCETAGCDPDRRVPLGDIGAAAAALGDVELARQSLEESLAIARQVSDRTQEILCLAHLGCLALREGQVAPALEHLRAALALAEQVNSLAEQPSLHAGLAEALWLAGDPDGAAAHVQQAADLAQATGQAHAQRLAQQVQTRVFAQEPPPLVVDC